MYRPYKFLITAIIQEVDDEGRIVQELSTEQPAVAFGVDGLQRYAETFEMELAAKVSDPNPATTPWVPMWALASGAFSGDLVYKGAYAAGSYKDGDIVVLNGITYICVRPTSAAPNPWPAPVYDLSAYQPKITYTTTFPASPVDGQIVVLVDNLTAPTYQWHFRYNASSTLAAKWEYIGGTSVTVRVETQENKIEQLPPGDLATVGPQFIVPRGGAYEVMWGCFYWFSNAPGVAYMDIQAGAANPANN